MRTIRHRGNVGGIDLAAVRTGDRGVREAFVGPDVAELPETRSIVAVRGRFPRVADDGHSRVRTSQRAEKGFARHG